MGAVNPHLDEHVYPDGTVIAGAYWNGHKLLVKRRGDRYVLLRDGVEMMGFHRLNRAVVAFEKLTVGGM